jgi:hypothetical protein
MEIVHEQGAGLASDLGRRCNDIGLGDGSHPLLAFAAIFGDIHDFVFKDKEVGLFFAGQPDHVFVVILDPAVYDLSIGQLNAHRLLLFRERLKVIGFFRGFFRG